MDLLVIFDDTVDGLVIADPLPIGGHLDEIHDVVDIGISLFISLLLFDEEDFVGGGIDGKKGIIPSLGSLEILIDGINDLFFQIRRNL